MPAAKVVCATWSKAAGQPRFSAKPVPPTISMAKAIGMRAKASASSTAKAISVSVMPACGRAPGADARS
jgi:hypothetical protein